ncbi:hypothetical protein R6Q57_015109 [Mikania cordata]
MVALKRLDRAFGQGAAEFWKEIMTLSLYKHENIVTLLGYCDDSDEKVLVYEYASKGSLDQYLNSNDLTWIQRLKICIGVAHGLAYLHNAVGTQQRVLHRLARQSYEQSTIHDIIYNGIKDEIDPDSLQVYATISYRCLNRDCEERPLATDVVMALETALQCQLNKLELAVNLAKQGNLGGAENLFVRHFQELYAKAKYEEAVDLAVESPQGILRTPETLAMLNVSLP